MARVLAIALLLGGCSTFHVTPPNELDLVWGTDMQTLLDNVIAILPRLAWGF